MPFIPASIICTSGCLDMAGSLGISVGQASWLASAPGSTNNCFSIPYRKERTSYKWKQKSIPQCIILEFPDILSERKHNVFD